MVYSYFVEQCSNCKKYLYIKFFKIFWFIPVTTGLGPDTIICSSCNTKITSRFKEWVQMSLPEKIWYLVLSIIFGIMIGFMTSIPIMVALENFKLIPPPYEVIIVPIAALILIIQLYRILLSLDRTENPGDRIVGFWNWETNLQFYGGMWIILMVLAGIPFLLMS